MDYGEILFLGKCNNSCYYCLGNEMLKAKTVDNMDLKYNELKNLDVFLGMLNKENCKTIYLSSVETEPLLYKDISRLIDYLHTSGFNVGIRTNGKCNNIYGIIKKLDAEISISINSLNRKTNKKICGNIDIPDIDKICGELSSINKKCRITIVVNKYNYGEIFEIIDKLIQYDCIEYVQLRKRYLYARCSDKNYLEDKTAYETIKEELLLKYNCTISNFHESMIYNIGSFKVSFWDDVFKKESIESINYFSDGKISKNNLLVPGYEK